MRPIHVLFLGAMVAVATFGCEKSEPKKETSQASPAPPSAHGAAAKATGEKPDGFDFELDKQPALEQTKELDALSEADQKAIFLEHTAKMGDISRQTMASGLSADDAIEVMGNAQNKAKYELGKKHGLTVAQINQLGVLGTRFGWAKKQP